MAWKRNVNVGIAKSHQFAGQLIGMQLAVANVLAQIVSVTSVVAGATMLAVQQFPSAWPLWIAAAGIGIGLALLIEGLTLGALIRIRVAGREIRTTEQALRKVRDEQLSKLAIPDLTNVQYPLLLKRSQQARSLIERECRKRCRQASRQARRDRRSSLVLALGGCLASMCGGGLFYHAILGGLGQLPSVALSAIFTLAVTGTFVSSEIFKDLQEQAIRENFVNGNLAESAMRQETRMQSLWAVHRHIGTYLHSPEAQQVISEGGKFLVSSILEELHQDLQRSLAPGKPHVPGAIVEGLSHAWPISATSVVQLAPISGSPQSSLPAEATSNDGQAQALSHSEAAETPEEPFTSNGEPYALREPAQLKSHLDQVERAMLQALEQAVPEEREALLRLAQEQSLPAFARTLQARYPGYASFFTEARVANVMAFARQSLPTTVPRASSIPGRLSPEPGSDQHMLNPEPGSRDTELSLAQGSGSQMALPVDGVLNVTNVAKIRHLNVARMASTMPQSSGQGTPRECIQAVMTQAQQQGIKLNYYEIAQAAGVSYSSVKRHAPAIRAELLRN